MKRGDIGSAIVQGGAGIAESYAYAAFGQTNTQTLRNVTLTAAFSLVGGAVLGYVFGGSPSVSAVFTPKVPGHIRVGIAEKGSETAWSHLITKDQTKLELIKGEADAYVQTPREPPSLKNGYIKAEVPVSPSQADAAQKVVNASITKPPQGLYLVGSGPPPQPGLPKYGLFSNDCTTYSSSVLNAAGVVSLIFGRHFWDTFLA